MTVRVVGAGLGRTGTLSLKLALEKLLDGPCYHMMELFSRADDVPVWHAAARDESVDWHGLLADYRACVDWPGASFWPELHEAFPDALVLLSVRDAESWWGSASETIFPRIRSLPADAPPPFQDWHCMVTDLIANRFRGDITDRASSIAAFEAHNERVRQSVPADRLLEWRATDGWEPLCAALDLPVPDEAFPRANSREDFLDRWR
jgi:hypothetical protein